MPLVTEAILFMDVGDDGIDLFHAGETFLLPGY